MKKKKKKQRMKKKSKSLRMEALYGYLFILPWLIGFFALFARPFVTSVFYAFQKVSFTPNGIVTSFNGLDNFYWPFQTDSWFKTKYLIPGITNFLYEVPCVIIFSLFVAILLNGKFKGRTFVRAMFFLPVIIASGIVIQLLKTHGLDTSMETENAYVFNSGGLEVILASMNFPEKITKVFTEISNRIFDIVWLSGIQIILYLSGLQSIPRAEYEAAQMEGATAWECFWKITWVRISPMTLVVVVYSIIDSFTNVSNKMISWTYDIYLAGNYGVSTAMGWFFCSIAFLVLIVATAVISRFVFYVNED